MQLYFFCIKMLFYFSRSYMTIFKEDIVFYDSLYMIIRKR